MKSKSAEKIKLTSYDDLFGSSEVTAEEKIVSVPIRLFHTFKDHPFRVLDDEKMQETVESVKRYGILMPGIVRPYGDGEYEMVAGHRRWRACELAGMEEMPVIIREMDDDTATVIMVDTNIQREDILPSEKAHAYKMKYEAMKHQGSKGEKHTADLVGEAAGESGRTVQRYIRLSFLISRLLDYVDNKRLSMKAGEKLSFLTVEEQEWVLEAIDNAVLTVTDKQAELFKNHSREKTLNQGIIYSVLLQKKEAETKVTLSAKKVRSYFPPAYTKEQVEEVIYTLLEQRRKGRRNRKMQEIQFDYFHGMEAEQYTFYRIPKILFTAECFKTISCEAKVLYGLLLDRMSLSIKNRWFDEEDRVYIIFTVEEIAELMNCGTQKAVRLLKELDSEKGIGLVEKRRLGLGKPNVIYVKNFMVKQPEKEEKEPEKPVNTQNCENHNSRVVKTTIQECPKSQFKNDENHNSGMMKTTIQECAESQFKNDENHNSGIVKITTPECPKSQSNNTDINNTDFSENEYSDTESSETDFNETDNILSNLSHLSVRKTAGMIDMVEEMEAYRKIIRENISYECFEDSRYRQQEEVDELVELMVEVMVMPDNSTVRIGGVDKPVVIVKNRFMKVEHGHIEYVVGCLEKNTSKVGNIRAYLLTTLYNSTMTIENYYRAEVNHDMYGGG